MKPSLKMLFIAMERACNSYSETGSPFAKARAIQLFKETHECLDDMEKLLNQIDEDGSVPDKVEVEA